MDKIQAKIQLQKYVVETIEYKINPGIEALNNKEQFNMDINISQNLHNDTENRIATLKLGCQIGKNDLENNFPFFLNIELVGTFSYDTDLDEAKCTKMLNLNGTAILFPYLRSLISMITTLCSIPPVIIPTINIGNLIAQNQKPKED